jgi:hypothetical protein
MTRLRDRCTDLVGEGRRRRVYVHPDNPDLVVKIAKTDLGKTWAGPRNKGRPKRREANYSNPGEWAVWNRVKGTDLERWFVPCVSISADGLELVQHRAEIDKGIPQGLPEWLYADASWHGFGIWNGSPRLVDYAHHKIMEALDALLR